MKRYGGLVATDHLDFSLAMGEVCGVIGPNGAGKSTLVGLLGGALQPSAGSIRFAGVDVTRAAAPERARAGIGRTYQIPRPFLDMSVGENLQVAQLALGATRPARELQAERMDILRQCGLADCAGLPARSLPLLRRKRLELARALALKPKLLLLDEVGAGLVDSEVTELIALIRSVANPGRSIVIIEHVIRVVKECCARLVVLNFGKRIAEGRTDDVLADDGVAAVYLGSAHGGAALQPPAQAATPLNQLVSAVPASRPGPLLELHGVCAGYGQPQVLHGLNLAIAARGLSAGDRAARLDQVYGLFPDLRERRLATGTAMSGGQQQMLAIGRALMARPRLAIFDEISLGLAPVMMDRLYGALAALRAAGLTMLLIEQDVDRALALADQVHVLERGVFALSGAAADVRANPRLRQLYIGGPG